MPGAFALPVGIAVCIGGGDCATEGFGPLEDAESGQESNEGLDRKGGDVKTSCPGCIHTCEKRGLAGGALG